MRTAVCGRVCVCACVRFISFLFLFYFFRSLAPSLKPVDRPSSSRSLAPPLGRSRLSHSCTLLLKTQQCLRLKKKNAYNNHWYFPVTCCFILSTQISGTCGCYLDIFGMLTSIEPDFFFFLAGTDNGHTVWLVNVSPSLDITPP